MTARLRRPLLTLVMLISGYWLYGLLAVPLIEPAVGVPRPSTPMAPTTRAVRSFAGLFPPGSWELEQPKVLETDQGTLLFDDYTSLDEGSIRLNRCALVCYLGSRPAPGAAPGEAADSRPVVMRAESGATIQFDGPLNLFGGRLSRVTGGRLAGEVTIFSPPSAAGAEDDLEIVTQGVQIEEQRIWTPHPLRFRYGPNRGTGRDLSIELQPRRQRQAGDRAELAGIKSLELVHLDFLEIQAAADVFELTGPVDGPQQIPGRSPSSSIEVRCQGPFHFNFTRNLATLSNRVDVLRHSQEGPSDQLRCELLELHFNTVARRPPPEREDTGSAPRQSQQVSSLQPTKIVATGFPVIVRAPSNGSSARAERMVFELLRRRLWLKDSNQLNLSTPSFDLATRQLEYELPERGQLGQFWASGPGSLHGHARRTGAALEVQWSQEIRLLAQAESHVLSLRGAATASMPEGGRFQAEQIDLFLQERLPAGTSGRGEVIVQRMRAVGQVDFDSPRFSGVVSEAKIWFEPPPKPQSSPLEAAAVADRSRPPPKAAADQKKFRLTGNVLHAQVALGEPAQLKRLSITGQVQLRETSAASRPLAFSGNHLELENNAAEQIWAELSGQPAAVSLQGLALVGETVTVSQEENRVSIQGPGSMTLPRQRQAEASPAVVPAIRIRWNAGMNFDGRQARFDENVVVKGGRLTKQDQVLRFSATSDRLQLALTRRVNLQQPNSASDHDVDVRELRFPGWVTIDEQLYDRFGKQRSNDQMQVQDLVIDQVSGRIHGVGPGWLIHRGPVKDVRQHNGARLPMVGSSAELAYLQVNFEREMAGNQHQREIAFFDRVLAIYGPIAAWHESLQVESRQLLREHDVMLTCQRLSVADMRPASEGLEAIEFQATGNATIVGQSFSGTGDRISYSRQKDLLILKGDGRRPAFLKFRKHAAADPVELQVEQVLFYPSSKNFKVPKIYSLEIPDVNQLRGAPWGSSSAP